MLKFFGKTLFKYTIFLHYKTSIIKLFISLILIAIVYFLYSDIIEELKAIQQLNCVNLTNDITRLFCINKLENYRLYALITKWVVIIIAILIIVSALNPKEKPKSKNKSKNKSTKKPTKIKSHKEAHKNKNVTKILGKDKLRSESDIIWEDLQK